MAGWKDLSLKGEIVSFRATDGVILSGLLCMPKGCRTAIIYLHGLTSAFYKPLPLKLGSKLAAHGFAFMSIQQRGSYKRYSMNVLKNNKWTRKEGGGGVERFEDSVYDIEGAVRYLKSRGIRRIYLEGHSTGCQKSVYYAFRKNDRSLKGLILLAPADDCNGWKRDLRKVGFERAVSFAKSKCKSAPLFWMGSKYDSIQCTARRFLSLTDTANVEARIFNYELPRLKEFGSVRAPILAIFGTKDEFLLKPAGKCLGILGINSGSVDFRGVPIKGADHGFGGMEDELSRVVVNWLISKEKLR